MYNLTENFNKILVIVNEKLSNHLNSEGNVNRRGPKPKFSDAQVIALNLTAECLMLDSENYLFKKMKKHKNQFVNLIDRSNFNRRKKNLFKYMEIMRKHLAQSLSEGEDTFVVDSMPLAICKFSRAKRIKICKETYESIPDYGFCAAQNTTYYGYKLHGLTSVNGVITDFDLSKASAADIHFLNDIKEKYTGCLILGDKAYLSDPRQTSLFEENRLLLKTPMRANQKDYVKQPAVFRKVRKRIETFFSQLYDQFKINRNYAKSFSGLATRILSKITGYTLLQFLNKFELKVDNSELCKVKHVLI
ncbi:MAG TPA: IS982 family transposase [Caldithrix sp.]|nr:IS982 family transposase [Caldithrix sp.]